MPRKKILGAANDDNSNKPYVSNYPVLQAWLEKHNARCMWQVPREPKPDDVGYDWAPQAYIECWMVRRPIIIVIYSNKMGWEMYSALDSAKYADTFEDAEKRLGIVPTPSPVCPECGGLCISFNKEK